MSLKKQNRIFFAFLLFYTVALFLLYYGEEVNTINSTMLAFSYEYGFISRGLVGTLFALAEKITPFSMTSYWGTMRFTQAAFVLFVAVLFFFTGKVLKYAGQMRKSVEYLTVFYFMFAIPFFSSQFNFGRSDMWMLMVSLLGALLLMTGKAEWLLIPLCGLGVMIHQGYVFMFVNIILVLLVYKALGQEKGLRRKYIILFALCFLTVSVLFIYMEKFSHGNGAAIYDSIISNAKLLSADGNVHTDVVDKEILGISLADREAEYRLWNRVEAPIFLLLMLPYLVIFISFFRRLFGLAKKKNEKMKYLFFLIGAGTMVPELILKCDYGRWVFAILSYYLVMELVLLGLGDLKVRKVTADLMHGIKACPAGLLLLVYPIVLQPLGDVAINGLCYQLAEKVNLLLKLW